MAKDCVKVCLGMSTNLVFEYFLFIFILKFLLDFVSFFFFFLGLFLVDCYVPLACISS